MKSFEDCATQRNLTDQDRAEARALGEHVKRFNIPIGEVLASPFCRTMETARLAFGKARRRNQHRPLQPRQPVARGGRPALPRRRRDRRGAPGGRCEVQRHR